MLAGGRNRLMTWTGTTIPYKPGKNDLLEATRRVGAVIAEGGVVAIAGEGRIGALEDRVAAAQRRAGVLRPALQRPARPDRDQRDELAAVRRRASASRSASPSLPPGRPDRAAVDAMTATLRRAAPGACSTARPTPERRGRLARWVTERFNDWPEGSREAALAAAARMAREAGAAPV